MDSPIDPSDGRRGAGKATRETAAPGCCPVCGRRLVLRAIVFAVWPTWIRCSFCRTRLRFERVWDVALVLFGSVFGLTALVVVPGWPGDPADHGRWVWIGLLVLAVLGLEWLAARVLRRRRLCRA